MEETDKPRVTADDFTVGQEVAITNSKSPDKGKSGTIRIIYKDCLYVELPGQTGLSVLSAGEVE